MALTEIQQTLELLKKSKSILIVFKKDWTGDSLASSLALAMAIKKIDVTQEKKIDIACHNFKPAENLSFLPMPEIKTELHSLQKFVISLRTSQTRVAEFSYDKTDGKLNIYIVPKEGQFEPKDVSTGESSYTYDLIVVIDSPDLESLGPIYEQNTTFFFSTPKINIGHSSQNEYFGNVNAVDLTASSTAEIIFNIINKLDESLIGEDMATCLLTGIISATKNFKSPSVTPQTLHIASQLVAKGGHRDQIIHHLYQNRIISTLKLWGRVLSRLKNSNDEKLVWSSVSSQDFLETATSPAELIDVIEELIVSMPKVEIVVFLYETKNGENSVIKSVVYSVKNMDALMLSKKFNPSGTQQLAKFSLPNQTLSEGEKIVIDEIKAKLEANHS